MTTIEHNFDQIFPYSIITAFKTDAHLDSFLSALVVDAIDDINDSKNDPNYMPPIVYSPMGKSYNFHYNFIVRSMAFWLDDMSIFHEFELSDNPGKNDAYKYGEFLICTIFEEIYNLMKINSKTIDLSRYKFAKSIEIKRSFFHQIVYKKGDVYTRFAAVPFFEKQIQKRIGDELYDRLFDAMSGLEIEQAAFRESACLALAKELKLREVPYLRVAV